MTSPAAERHRFTVLAEDEGRRLDQVLAARVPGLSRQRARVLIDIGGVFVDSARVKVAGRLLRAGQTVEAHTGGALERATKAVGRAARERDAAALPSPRIIHLDEDVVVVDKPASLITAPTPESDRSNLADLLRRRLGGELYVVHRLDLGTSGLLVLARTSEANRVLGEHFRVHDIERVYLAVLRGRLDPAGGRDGERTVDLAIDGRRAVTHFQISEALGPGELATLVRCRLETGRTHQIRIHARHLGHPVLGDRQYGQRTAFDPPRMALHATRLGFRHPRTGAQFEFESPLPDDLAGWLAELRARAATPGLAASAEPPKEA
ncbi:MAG TPA: RluA family pseudouridine synthase [Polyangia bacterium]|jgi:23S rRNA pseudouridine1911/1915/1917 synthase|nr:RluA family pseudouridine synthase [Polyangia bacterium]